MKKWRVVFTKQPQRDTRKLARPGLRPQAEKLLQLLAQNPYRTPLPYEKLAGALAGACSRRINIQHRLVYPVLEDIRTAKVVRMWTHYD